MSIGNTKYQSTPLGFELGLKKNPGWLGLGFDFVGVSNRLFSSIIVLWNKVGNVRMRHSRRMSDDDDEPEFLGSVFVSFYTKEVEAFSSD